MPHGRYLCSSCRSETKGDTYRFYVRPSGWYGTYGLNINSVIEILDEQNILLIEIENSVYVKPFTKEIDRLKGQQKKLRALLEEWRALQESYINVSTIFKWYAGKIPGAASKFEAIDQQWRNTIETIRTRECKYLPSAFSLIDNIEIIEDIINSNKACEEIYASMETYVFHMRQNTHVCIYSLTHNC